MAKTKTKTKPAAKKIEIKKTSSKLLTVAKKSVNNIKVVTPKKKTTDVKKIVSSKISVTKTVNVPAKITKKKVSIKPQAEVIENKIRKFKPNKKTRYSKVELKNFRDIILKERKAIFESAKANMDALVDKDSGEYKGDNLTYSSHMAEQGTDEMEREKNYLFVQRDEKYLGYLQDALTRIDQGTYGICVDCRDEPKNLCKTCPLIAVERLELVPITQHCIECKNLRG